MNWAKRFFHKFTTEFKLYFGFNQNESRAFVYIILAIFLLSICPIVYESFLLSQASKNEPWHSDIIFLDHKSTSQEANGIKVVATSDKFINPNFASESELISIGIPKYLAARMVKFRSKGGRFYSNKDLLKIYGFKEELLVKVSSHIVFDKIEQVNKPIYHHDSSKASWKNNYAVVQKNSSKYLDINSIDSIQLCEISGVKPFVVSKILRYRNHLGGFVDTLQLYEIKGVWPSSIHKLIQSISINGNNLKKINVNVSSALEMSKHPYINFKMASTIENYRLQHGKYKLVDDLLKTIAITEADLKRIRPYISLE